MFLSRSIIIVVQALLISYACIAQSNRNTLLDELQFRYRNVRSVSYDAAVFQKAFYRSDTNYVKGHVTMTLKDNGIAEWDIYSFRNIYHYRYANDTLTFYRNDTVVTRERDPTGVIGNIDDRLLIMRNAINKIKNIKDDSTKQLSIRYKEATVELRFMTSSEPNNQVESFQSTYIFDSASLNLIGYRNEAVMTGDHERQYVYVAISNILFNN